VRGQAASAGPWRVESGGRRDRRSQPRGRAFQTEFRLCAFEPEDRYQAKLEKRQDNRYWPASGDVIYTSPQDLRLRP